MIISNAFLWVINESFQKFFTLSEDNLRVLGSAKLASVVLSGVVIFIYYGNTMLFFFFLELVSWIYNIVTSVP